MFGIAWSEILLILAVAVLVIGPKDMPRALHTAGKMVRKVKLFTNEIQKSLDHIVKEVELTEIEREANKPGAENLQFEIEKQVQAEARRKAEAEAIAAESKPLPRTDDV